MKATLLERLVKSVKGEAKKFDPLDYGKYVAILTVVLSYTIYADFLKYIWPSVQNIMNERWLYMCCIIGSNFMVTIAFNIVMYFIYTMKIPFFQQYRVNKDAPWPWETSDQTEWKKFMWKSIRVNLRNVFIVSPIVIYISEFLGSFEFKMKSTEFPTTFEMLWQTIFFILVHEVSFYFVHRTLHTPRFYWIHKTHHEYNVPISLAVQHAHIIEQIFANLIPSGLGYKILSGIYPTHIITIMVYIALRSLETLQTHSGYEWPWSQPQLLLFSAGSKYHYFHHKQNVGNYGGILHIVDTIFDTNKDFNQFQEKNAKKENEQKKNQKGTQGHKNE